MSPPAIASLHDCLNTENTVPLIDPEERRKHARASACALGVQVVLSFSSSLCRAEQHYRFGWMATSQISRQYSRIVRSEENLPDLAVLSTDMRLH